MWENDWGSAVKCTVLWSRAMKRPYHNNDKRELWVKKAKLKCLKGSVSLQRKKPVEEIQHLRRKGSTQIHPEPVFPRVCQHETAVRRGLYLTKALYYSRPLGKSCVSVRLDEKDPDQTPPSSDQIRTLWAVTHLQPPRYSLKTWEWLSTPIKHGNKSAASDAVPGDQISRFKDQRAAVFEASSRAPWWSVNKHV